MKSFITPKYVFTPGNAGVGTLDLSLIKNFDIKRLVAVININSNAIIYNVANSAAGFTTVSNGVITLDYNTSAMSSSDLLQIIYDNDDSISNNELIEAIEAMRMAIQSLNRSIGMAQVNPLTGRMLVDGSGVTQPVSGTVSVGTPAVSQSGTWNQQQIGGQNANSVVTALERSAADNLRRNIIVT
jgi:hypothetical protein